LYSTLHAEKNGILTATVAARHALPLPCALDATKNKKRGNFDKSKFPLFLG
jgi:hypothetical protein